MCRRGRFCVRPSDWPTGLRFVGSLVGREITCSLLPTEDLQGTVERMAGYADAAAMSGALLRAVKGTDGDRLFLDEAVTFWTEHSERAARYDANAPSASGTGHHQYAHIAEEHVRHPSAQSDSGAMGGWESDNEPNYLAGDNPSAAAPHSSTQRSAPAKSGHSATASVSTDAHGSGTAAHRNSGGQRGQLKGESAEPLATPHSHADAKQKLLSTSSHKKTRGTDWHRSTAPPLTGWKTRASIIRAAYLHPCWALLLLVAAQDCSQLCNRLKVTWRR